MSKNVYALLLWIISLGLFAQGNASFDAVLEADTSEDELVFYRPSNVFQIPDLFQGQFEVKAVPIKHYTEEELALQEQLNQKEEAVVTFSGGDDRFFAREIDRQAITPYTWKWVELRVDEGNGSHYEIHLRRPNSWFIANNVTQIGDKVPVKVPEIGLDGIGDVIGFAPNQLDTRIWDTTYPKEGYVLRPITGKFTHHANNVVKIYFDQHPDIPISVTGNHLLWSITRDAWTTVDDLEIGEVLQNKDGEVVLQAKEKQEGFHQVYDLELYRDHNFLVGSQSLLAHNGCDGVLSRDYTPGGKHAPGTSKDKIKSIVSNDKNGNPLGQWTSEEAINKAVKKYNKKEGGVQVVEIDKGDGIVHTYSESYPDSPKKKIHSETKADKAIIIPMKEDGKDVLHTFPIDVSHPQYNQ